MTRWHRYNWDLSGTKVKPITAWVVMFSTLVISDNWGKTGQLLYWLEQTYFVNWTLCWVRKTNNKHPGQTIDIVPIRNLTVKTEGISREDWLNYYSITSLLLSRPTLSPLSENWFTQVHHSTITRVLRSIMYGLQSHLVGFLFSLELLYHSTNIQSQSEIGEPTINIDF